MLAFKITNTNKKRVARYCTVNNAITYYSFSFNKPEITVYFGHLLQDYVFSAYPHAKHVLSMTAFLYF